MNLKLWKLIEEHLDGFAVNLEVVSRTSKINFKFKQYLLLKNTVTCQPAVPIDIKYIPTTNFIIDF